MIDTEVDYVGLRLRHKLVMTIDRLRILPTPASYRLILSTYWAAMNHGPWGFGPVRKTSQPDRDEDHR